MKIKLGAKRPKIKLNKRKIKKKTTPRTKRPKKGNYIT